MPKAKLISNYNKRRMEATKIQYEYLVEKHCIRSNHTHYHIVDKYSHRANNVLNAAIYQCRQGVFKHRSMSWTKLDAYFKHARNCGQANIYSQMPAVHLVQQLFKLVSTNFDSWLKAVKAYQVALINSQDGQSYRVLKPKVVVV